MEDARVFGLRVRELRCWRGLSLRQAAGLAGLTFSFWGQIERGEKPVTSRPTLNAIANALRVHPTDLTGQPWTPQDVASGGTPAALVGIETALERYQLGMDPELPVRAWPEIAADLERLTYWDGDYAVMAELVPVLLGELQGAYVRLPQRRSEVLVGLMRAYASAIWTAKCLGGCGLPSLAARAVQQCAEALSDPIWLGYATYLRGDATGRLDRAGQYRRSVAAAQDLTSRLDCSDALQACGMLHLSAAWAGGAQADRDTMVTHLQEASALASRMDTEVGTWAHLWFGPTNVGIWKTSIALELGEPGQALRAAKTVHPDLLPSRGRQAMFWVEVGRALVVEKKTREQGVHLLARAERLAPQMVRHSAVVRDTVTNLLRQSPRDASGRELRGLAWRMGLAPIR
ncbi:MAG: helix-turn-helix transcriptional regulator [Pseudonocardiales bacterium]|nr:helix-turn-helix transcriptional regulator [Pseudonocardiales bacterium]